MLRLYLHIRSGDDLVEDLEGAEFESLDSARHEAIEAARELMSDRVKQGRAADGSRFEITDETGKILLVIQFREALAPEGP